MAWKQVSKYLDCKSEYLNSDADDDKLKLTCLQHASSYSRLELQIGL